MNSTKALAAVLLAGASTFATTNAALGAKPSGSGTSATTATATDARIRALEEQIQTLSDQVVDLKRSSGDQ